jgi:NADH dehydrogenase
MIEAARRAGVRRFVHQGALGTEDDPNLHYASSKAKGDKLVEDSRLDWTILKPSLIWGERDGFFNIMADLVRISPGVVPVPAGARSRYQPIGIADVARCVVACFADQGRVGRTFELGGPSYWTYGGMLGEVLRGMGARRATLPMPVPLIRLVAGTSELLGLPFPVATDQLRQLGLDNTTSLLAVREAFGFDPAEMAGNLGYLRRPKREQEPWPGD